MFERFTDRARRVVVLAQEEARELGHTYIGTEHILLGLLREPESVAARALEALGIGLDAVRQQVREIIGQGEIATLPSHIPFTPRAKKVLELSLREALQLGHNYIGTEHILLGLIREGEGVAAQVLVKLGADLNRVRQQVIMTLHAGEAEAEQYLPGDLPGEGSIVVEEESSSVRRTARASGAAHVAPPAGVIGSRIQLESLNVRLSEMVSRLDQIAERLAAIEGHLAEGRRPAARAPRKPAAPRKPKPPPAEPPAGPDPGSPSGETKPA
jgi:ATP-dependent Clp protease ATP-binding subunit ClpC